jgi:hypothetical protein
VNQNKMTAVMSMVMQVCASREPFSFLDGCCVFVEVTRFGPGAVLGTNVCASGCSSRQQQVSVQMHGNVLCCVVSNSPWCTNCCYCHLCCHCLCNRCHPGQ